MTTEIPLVSIIVITYNSSEFVLETLESAKAQTYQNIELIISDDSSTDNTLDLCRKWIAENRDRFRRTQLVTVEQNTGIPANCNRGVKASTGEWLKIIAGDDILFSNCVLDNTNFVLSNKDVKICQSTQRVYKDTFEESNFLYINSFVDHVFSKTDYRNQYKLLQFGCLVNAPSIFMKQEIILSLGGFDEDLPMEDWPFWLKVTAAKNKIYSLNKTTVGYRVHGTSEYNKNNEFYLFNDFFKKERLIQEKIVFDQCSILSRIFIDYKYYLKVFFDNTRLNRDKLLNRKLFWIMSLPFMVYFKLLSHAARK
ncbi:MAG: glycosyltransferase [Flavobacteriales bacterium]|nr:glycosyltransferase [Flavobacteriales bacterium]